MIYKSVGHQIFKLHFELFKKLPAIVRLHCPDKILIMLFKIVFLSIHALPKIFEFDKTKGLSVKNNKISSRMLIFRLKKMGLHINNDHIPLIFFPDRSEHTVFCYNALHALLLRVGRICKMNRSVQISRIRSKYA